MKRFFEKQQHGIFGDVRHSQYDSINRKKSI